MISIRELGEFGLVARITRRLALADRQVDRRVDIGPGDDAAVLLSPDGRVVATTDLLIEGRHFRLDWSSGYDAGRKAAAQNLADIAAMGARPTALLVGLGVPPRTAVDLVDDIVDGLRDEGETVGAPVIGGDIVGDSRITLAVTALGDLEGRQPVTRSGARPGDIVAVAGRLGYAAAGLALLDAGLINPEKEVEDGTEREAEGEFVAAHRQPRPPYGSGPAAAALGATALIDVSDGLVQDLGHVAAASGVSIALTGDALPIRPSLVRVAARVGVDPVRFVLAGGEDHALAGTFPAGTRLPAEWMVIGDVHAGESAVTVDGKAPGWDGWDHFG